MKVLRRWEDSEDSEDSEASPLRFRARIQKKKPFPFFEVSSSGSLEAPLVCVGLVGLFCMHVSKTLSLLKNLKNCVCCGQEELFGQRDGRDGVGGAWSGLELRERLQQSGPGAELGEL